MGEYSGFDPYLPRSQRGVLPLHQGSHTKIIPQVKALSIPRRGAKPRRWQLPTLQMSIQMRRKDEVTLPIPSKVPSVFKTVANLIRLSFPISFANLRKTNGRIFVILSSI